MKKTLITLSGLLIFAGCSLKSTEMTSTAEIIEKIESTHEVTKTVELKLTQTQITPKTFKVALSIDNPEKKEITSARTWLAYNPQDLKIVQLDTQNSDFDLAAPGENEFDAEMGLIKIGRSSTENQINSAKIMMAEIMVEKIHTGSMVLDFYNYHTDETGHTSVNMLLNNQVYNIAQKPMVPSLVLK